MTTELSGCVMFAGGGTGGHLFPGVAVAQALTSRHPGVRVVFIGSGRPLEARVLARAGFPLETVRAVGLAGRSWGSIARGLVALPTGGMDSWRLLRRYRPQAVVGLGAYSSGPIVMLAALTRVPTMLLEQNAVPGVTNRVLGRVARSVAVSYDASLSYFGAHAFVSGNPVRAEFFEAAGARPILSAPHVVVLGGSQGAHALNMAMVEAVPAVAAAVPRLRITHQTGEADVALVADAYRRTGVDARVEPFLDRVAEVVADADVMVCRAGATTLAEIAAAGRPAVLVPYPYATHDHQRRNAAVVRDAGAADVIDPDELSSATLTARLGALLADDRRRVSMARASRALAVPEAADRIVARMERLMAHHGRER